jgi:hypothetical protein
MTRFLFFALTIPLGWIPAGMAQRWEVGGITGGGINNSLTVSSFAGSASAGFSPGVSAGAFLGQNLYRNLSGELRYDFQVTGLKVSSGGSDATFNGQTHTLHYDVLWHLPTRRARLRPFVAGGAGIRAFRGTGEETAYQPLADFALLTRTEQYKLMVCGGGGLKYAITPRLTMRAEVLDYASPFPSKVIAPGPGARLGGWLNDVVPMVGLSFVF